LPKVYVSIGSNVDRKKNICSCLDELKNIFGELQVSAIYENKSVGFDGENFYNLVVMFETLHDVKELTPIFREIESMHGRIRGGEKFSSRTLDVDLLLYDDLILKSDSLKVPRDEIIRYAFVLRPLSEIAPNLIHPELGKTISELWASFKSKDKMRAVELPV